MDGKKANTTAYQDVDETSNYTELQNLNDAPPPEPDASIQYHQRRPQTRTLRFTRYLHPVAWLLLLCIGGPILLHELPTHYFGGAADLNGIVASQQCDVQPVWSSWATLFQINIRTGNLSFATAKVIDVAFDLVIGRGGQLVLAWISYRAYTDVLIRIAEKGRLRYDAFASMAVTQPVTFVWFAATLSYLPAYPTLVSASTSLVGATSSAIQLPNNATAPLLDYIHSASYSLANTGLDDKPDPWIISTSHIHALPADACNIMVLGGSNWSPSRYDKTHITVNKTVYDINEDTVFRCGFYYGGTFYNVNTTWSSGSSGNDRFYASQIICVPDGNQYQWGASWEMLVVVLALQVAWGFAMLVVWVEASTRSALVKEGRKMGLYSALLDLSGPLRACLEGQGESQSAGHAYSEADLKKLVDGMQPVGYEVGHEALEDGSGPTSVRLASGIEDDTGQLLGRRKT